jgi:hypothetical protein
MPSRVGACGDVPALGTTGQVNAHERGVSERLISGLSRFRDAGWRADLSDWKRERAPQMVAARVRTARLRWWLVLAAAMPLVTACTKSDGLGGPATTTAHRAGVSSPAHPMTSANCTSAEARMLVERFVHAFNAGDERALQHLWARRGEGFKWYSTDGPGQRLRREAMDRVGLGQYFARRHAAGETLHLTSFQFNGNTAGYGNFQDTLIRSATRLPPTAYIGKGAAVCDRMPSTLTVWSMGKDPRP